MSSSTSSSSLRVAALALAFLGAIGAGSLGVAIGARDAVVAAGAKALEHRPAALVDPRREAPERPLAVFLGDSTFLPGYAYPRVLAQRYAGRAEVRAFWWEGFEPFHHYLLIGRAMELSPEAVVIVAQPRVFWRHEPLWYEDLLTLVPPYELHRAVRLPFHERGVSVPRLVLGSLLGSLRESGETLLRGFVGARRRADDVPGLRWLVPIQSPNADPRRLAELRAQRLAQYDMPIYEDHPAVRALAATVEQAVRRGANTLVLLSPIPVELLREAGLYDDEVFARRVEVVARAVEAQGGDFLDLHAVLGPDEFTDAFGHMAEPGAQKMVRVVDPWLGKALGLRKR